MAFASRDGLGKSRHVLHVFALLIDAYSDSQSYTHWGETFRMWEVCLHLLRFVQHGKAPQKYVRPSLRNRVPNNLLQPTSLLCISAQHAASIFAEPIRGIVTCVYIRLALQDASVYTVRLLENEEVAGFDEIMDLNDNERYCL